jgi:predicted GIY-YIG superfamily endonuclease
VIYIYALNDPESGAILYVGRTADVRQRFANHLLQRQGNAQKRDWIAALAKDG